MIETRPKFANARVNASSGCPKNIAVSAGKLVAVTNGPLKSCRQGPIKPSSRCGTLHSAYCWHMYCGQPASEYFMKLFLLFVCVPLIEIGLFVQVGGFIGLWPTLIIVVLTAVLGTWLLRIQAQGVIYSLKIAAEQGLDPTPNLVHGILVFVSALLLLTPGFFTDAVGLSLMSPHVREWVIRWFGKQFASQAYSVMSRRTSKGPRSVEIIEGQAEDIDPDNQR